MPENDEQNPVVVSTVSNRKQRRGSNDSGADVSSSSEIKARGLNKVATSAMSIRTGSNYGGNQGMFAGPNTMMGTATNIYSPHLSTDFLELPRTRSERRAYYRHFYENDPYVHAAINLHTELPLSKIRLTLPKSSDPDKNQRILKFYEDMVDRIDLLEKLIDATREYHVIGEAFLFAEDREVEVPEELLYQDVSTIEEDGTHEEHVELRDNAEAIAEKYVRNNYEGWQALKILPPDQVQIENVPFAKTSRIELEPDDETRELVNRAAVEPAAAEKAQAIPEQIKDYIRRGENLPLDTDPYEGSFCYHLARNKPDYRDHGTSTLQCVLRPLVHKDKLRQAQASIASRAMTPKRLVWAEDLSEPDVDDLREQVNLALLDPDHSIITNYQVNWEEINARDRLLDLKGEHDIIEKELFAGLGVTRAMLTGDAMYSGERINLEVINNKYMLYRERMQKYVDDYLFKPVAAKRGWTEKDEFGNERLLHPRLSFTRLAIRDNRDTFDTMFNLYQKGSLSVSYILELFNLDPQAVRERIERDLFTVSDPTFNEMVRNIYSEVGRNIVESSDIVERLVDYLSEASNYEIEYVEQEEGGGRY